MSAAVTGATYSPSSPLELHYSDSTSSIHPDRPIRPLPKRRLRSRLSADVAESILYPVAATSPSQPLLQYPYRGLLGDKTGELSGKAVNLREGPTNGDEDSDSYQFRGNVVYSDDEEPSGVARRYQEQRQRLAGMNTFSKNGYTVPRTVASKYMKPPIPQSTASSGDSVDGYESFENTNNKKKRKIPTSGSLGNHHTSLSTDMAQMGISSSRGIEVLQAESDTVVGHYYGTGHSAAPAVSLQPGTGLSGPGRGRYGRAGPRHRSGRSPLGVSLNGSNTSHASRSLHHRRDHPSSDIIGETGTSKASNQGIISAAIASAAALPATPTEFLENRSLFEQQSSKKSNSAKTQFTFTCESDSAKSMVWPPDVDISPSSSGNYSAVVPKVADGHNSKINRGFATQGTQTSPKLADQANQTAANQAGANQQVPQQAKKPRRPLEKQYSLAARDRRLRQEYTNYHHPPKEEDVWICEFCEYESIFGVAPKALIRQYEAKDRRERKRLAEKRRLLEKAKMKGRKGKKGNKKNGNAVTQAQHPAHTQRYDQPPMNEVPVQHHRMQSDDYGVDDDDADDDDPIPPPRTPSKIPQPVAQNYNQSLRPPSGSAIAKNADRKASD